MECSLESSGIAVESRRTRKLAPSRTECSIKGEVKEKHLSEGWKFSCFSAHMNEQDVF
jgi:hypothetical protein